MAKFQINYNHRKIRGKKGKIVIDIEPEQNDLSNFYDAFEKEGFTILEIENDLILRLQNLENKKLYCLKDDGSGLEQRR